MTATESGNTVWAAMVATDAELFFAQVVVGQIDKPGCGCHSGSAYPSNLAD